MIHILCIETGTTTCSVALGNNEGVIGYKEIADAKAHASQLSVLVASLMDEEGFDLSRIDAVAVSKGPGSYTGLRIGVSFAKGVCYALGKPLLAIGSLDSMVSGVSEFIVTPDLPSNTLFCPMIDARRMEVYAALFNRNESRITDVEAVIVDSSSYADSLQKNPIVFFGNGAPKCKSVISNQNAIFIDNFEPSARFMLPLALKAYKDEAFEDIAYFEPFYLKDFVATVSKNKIIPGT
ncbi:MAG: tRNA (adenosine(37)-N6)-threonylcarbamoyltransferase complex dimerization subunit type 1 TsaB [Bacteroidales bacterium]|nr:tRNA (adenosine(37)-N6)-threonylcarbamoyltransferase complex dimerization subunit type 1 TsaB [Bacteroidales bacterium]